LTALSTSQGRISLDANGDGVAHTRALAMGLAGMLWRGAPDLADGPTLILVQRHSTRQAYDAKGERLLVERADLRRLRR
jgi:hypothetical protein